MAFDDLFPKNQFVVNVEPSDSMNKLGKYLTHECKNLTWVGSLSETLRFEHHKTYDVVSVSHVLEEVPTPESSLDS